MRGHYYGQLLTDSRVPRHLRPAVFSLLSYVSVLIATQPFGFARLLRGAKSLVLASCMPSVIACGWSLSTCAMSLLENRQASRLFALALLDLHHLQPDLSTLVYCGNYLESTTSTKRFAATVVSLTALSNGLYAAQTWIGKNWLGVRQVSKVSSYVSVLGMCSALQLGVGVTFALAQGYFKKPKKQHSHLEQFHGTVREARDVLQQNSQLRRHHSIKIAKRVVADVLVHMAGLGLAVLARKARSCRHKRRRHSSSTFTWHTEEMFQLQSDSEE